MSLKRKKKKNGTIRWAILLSIVLTLSAVIAFLITSLVRYYFFGSEDRNFIVWSAAIYQIMGACSGITIAAVSTMLYQRMERLLGGLREVAKGNLEVELSTAHSGEYQMIYETFNVMVKELKKSEAQQLQFINDFSHEFKTPIHSIQGLAEYLSENELPRAEQQSYLNLIAAQAKRLGELSENTLLLSKLEAQDFVREKKKYRLDDQIRRCIILLLKKAEMKNIQLNPNMEEIWFYGNEKMLEEVWINLLDNAIKYSGEYTNIWIQAGIHEGQIQVSIQDEGIGMDDETIVKIFEKYYQVDSSRQEEGYGLGLSIVKRIVDICGGKITVESQLGSGTTIHVSI